MIFFQSNQNMADLKKDQPNLQRSISFSFVKITREQYRLGVNIFFYITNFPYELIRSNLSPRYKFRWYEEKYKTEIIHKISKTEEEFNM